jgi:hypothetical protein
MYNIRIAFGLRLNRVAINQSIMFTRKKEKKEYNAYIANILSKHSACVTELSRLYNGKYPQRNFWSFEQFKTPENE